MPARRSPAALLIPGAALLLLLGVGYLVAGHVRASEGGQLHQSATRLAEALTDGDVAAAWSQVLPAARTAEAHASMRDISAAVRGSPHRLEVVDPEQGITQISWFSPVRGQGGQLMGSTLVLTWQAADEGAWGLLSWQPPADR